MSFYQPHLSLPFELRKFKFKHRFQTGRAKYNDLLQRYYWELDRKKRDWEKNYDLSTQLGHLRWSFDNRGKTLLKERKSHREKQTELREELRKTISAYERKIKKLNHEIEIQQKKVDEAFATKDKYLNRVKQDRRHKKAATERALAAEKELSDVKKANEFLAKKMDWNSQEDAKVELLLRSMLTVTPLLDKKVVTYTEMFYLAVGYQKDYFSQGDIAKRFGDEKVLFWKRDMNRLVKANYAKRVHRKDYYYLTPDGINRLRDIMKYVFTQTYQTYFKIPTT